MLCLLAHAFLVSVTHHHNSPRDRSTRATANVTADNSRSSGATPGSAGDAHCLSCRLQRNFASNVHPASVVVQLLQEPLCREISPTEPRSSGACFIFSDRAPPTA